MTARSLKTKYALTALGLGAVVALLLAGALFWQYRLDATRLSGLAFDSVEQKLLVELLAHGEAMADQRARELAPVMAGHDWAGAHVIATEILDSRDVAAVELKDDLGTVVFAASNHAAAASRSVGTIKRSIRVASPEATTRTDQPTGELSVSMSRASVDAALEELAKDVGVSQRDHFRDLMTLLATACGMLIAAGFISAWLLARRIERPIMALIKSADRIGQGDYTRPFSVARGDEIGELQQSLDRMRQNCARRRSPRTTSTSF